MTDSASAAILLLQIAFILAVCRALGSIFARLRQPLVVAEMVAGFLLGPSLFGWALPQLQLQLFPPDSLRTLYVLSQIGLVLYMFCVGLEFRIDLLTRYWRSATGVAGAGIAVPFVLGGALALVMVRSGGFYTPQVRALDAMLFLGAAMSVTAFPMLARIISERGIAGTTVGSLALAAGAADDAVAWIIFAIVVGRFTGHTTQPLMVPGGALLYVAVVWLAVRPLFSRLAAAAARVEALSTSSVVAVLCLLACGAWFTDFIGVHSVFGAFVLGVSVPRGVLARELRAITEPLTSALFLPLFFVYSGLNTRVTLIDSAALWGMTAVVFATACAGKGLACWGAARLSGLTSKDALAVATLMNARGMVELILVNVGLQRGVITPTMFTILVIMAIGTTLMTGPVFTAVWNREPGMAAEPWLAADRVP
jgi:Kef-type K+ transport system membrane component KefB